MVDKTGNLPAWRAARAGTLRSGAAGSQNMPSNACRSRQSRMRVVMPHPTVHVRTDSAPRVLRYRSAIWAKCFVDDREYLPSSRNAVAVEEPLVGPCSCIQRIESHGGRRRPDGADIVEPSVATVALSRQQLTPNPNRRSPDVSTTPRCSGDEAFSPSWAPQRPPGGSTNRGMPIETGSDDSSLGRVGR